MMMMMWLFTITKSSIIYNVFFKNRTTLILTSYYKDVHHLGMPMCLNLNQLS